jgi:predicted DNA binding protein
VHSSAAKKCSATQSVHVPLTRLFGCIQDEGIEVIGKEDGIKKFLQDASKWSPYKVLGLTSLDRRSESLLWKLTFSQRQALLTACALGYYDVPRRIFSEELSKPLKTDKSTVVEHLRKAERKLIASIIAR